MAAVGKIPRVSFEQFLLLLEMSHTKLEWLDGVAYAMAGGSFEHSRRFQTPAWSALSRRRLFQPLV